MHVSNPDRVVFPEAGLTKADVVAHYARVGEAMLPHMGGAPLTLERYPKGISGKGFMQKNAARHYPESIERYEVPKKDGTTIYPVVRQAPDLAYLANQGTITFHAWTSRIEHIWLPERIVIDLDPPAGGADIARRAALLVRDALAELELASTPVATGSKGYHVIVPIRPTTPFDRIGEMAQGLALLLSAEHPELLTLEFRKENRRGRVFVDWLRNMYGATSVVPWSLRPLPGAPVTVPIDWTELDSTEPDTWRLDAVAARLEQGDPVTDLVAEASAAADAVTQLLEDRNIELPRFDRFRS